MIKIIFTVNIAIEVTANLHSLLQYLAASDTFETVEMKLVSTNAPHILQLTELEAAASTGWTADDHVVMFTIKLTIVTVARCVQCDMTHLAPDTCLMVHLVLVISHSDNIGLVDTLLTLAALHLEAAVHNYVCSGCKSIYY